MSPNEPQLMTWHNLDAVFYSSILQILRYLITPHCTVTQYCDSQYHALHNTLIISKCYHSSLSRCQRKCSLLHYNNRQDGSLCQIIFIQVYRWSILSVIDLNNLKNSFQEAGSLSSNQLKLASCHKLSRFPWIHSGKSIIINELETK